MVPVQLRVGGAFMGIALVLVLYAVLALLRGDAAFPVTPQVLSVIAAVAIVGAFAGTSRHDGMTAAEIGADYVSFGPLAAGGLGDGGEAPLDLFQWWSEMIEVPVVAEGALDPELVEKLLPVADFVAIGPEIWSDSDPVAALKALWG